MKAILKKKSFLMVVVAMVIAAWMIPAAAKKDINRAVATACPDLVIPDRAHIESSISHDGATMTVVWKKGNEQGGAVYSLADADIARCSPQTKAYLAGHKADFLKMRAKECASMRQAIAGTAPPETFKGEKVNIEAGKRFLEKYCGAIN